MEKEKSLLILGTRGIPASHGGFETFAEHLSLFLVRRGWHVAVYCQHDVEVVTRRTWTDTWNGVERIHIEVGTKAQVATLDFDWRCIRDAAKRDSLCLVLGYNSALFLPYLRFAGRTILINMDGIEWRREKWSRPIRAWFWVNEWIAAWTAQHLIADHPAIADHLATRRRKPALMIPYGGVPVEAAAPGPVVDLGLTPDRYLIAIARIEPENNILAIVSAFSQVRRNAHLVVLGSLDEGKAHHRAIRRAASDEVLFPGAIYDAAAVQALRFHARAYVHGHSVGGTNPSLVEALWAGNAVIAHDNAFNRWTAGDAQAYFSDTNGCAALMTALLDDDARVKAARDAARAQARLRFDWTEVLSAYEKTFLSVADVKQCVPEKQPARTAVI